MYVNDDRVFSVEQVEDLVIPMPIFPSGKRSQLQSLRIWSPSKDKLLKYQWEKIFFDIISKLIETMVQWRCFRELTRLAWSAVDQRTIILQINFQCSWKKLYFTDSRVNWFYIEILIQNKNLLIGHEMCFIISFNAGILLQRRLWSG